MLFWVPLVTSAIAFTPIVDFTPVGMYRAPRHWEVRSSCPGLNTLANHGFLPRNGKGITKEMVTKAFKDVYNVGEDISTFLIDQTFAIGLNDTATTFSLESISLHTNPQSKIEHDASLVHPDFYHVKNTITIDPQLVNRMKAYATNRRGLTYNDLIRYRKDRNAEAIKNNPEIDYGQRPQFLASAEVALLFHTFKNSNNEISLHTIDNFLWYERLPIGFIKQQQTLTLAQVLGTAADVRAKWV